MPATEAMIRAYLDCALWSSTDDSGEPLDSYDLDPVSRDALVRELHEFVDYVDSLGIDWSDHWTAERLAHDFWLTRNRHGAGFWDRYYGDQEGARIGRALTEAARAFGSLDLYLGDDGRVHVYGAAWEPDNS
ncbi:MAG TPA: hypothetical protein VEA41_22620 [Salinarimonas sp.]|nr:hypothetical protein [Salinarimonas sp.]